MWIALDRCLVLSQVEVVGDASERLLHHVSNGAIVFRHWDGKRQCARRGQAIGQAIQARFMAG